MAWQDELQSLLGSSVLFDEASLRANAGDKWFATHLPEALVLAKSTQEVATTLQFASRHGIAVTARGAGVGYVGGCVPVQGGIVLSLAAMKRIVEIAPQDGVAVVEAGVLTADLQEACERVGWFYPPDPASRKESSIGGNIGTNAGGPRCLKYGVTRAYLLGLTVVMADGRILHAGGRTHKNKQGFDLVGLFCGSEGMLGVITEATLRMIPQPPARLALQAHFADFALAAQAVQNILQAGHLPAALEITDAFTLEAARKYLGAGVLQDGAKGHLIVEIDGPAHSLLQELRSIEACIKQLGGQCQLAQSPSEVEAIWQIRREFSYSLRATGLTKLNEDVVIPRSQLVALVEFCQSMQARTGIPIACFGHAGDGNIHTNIMIPRDAQGHELKAEAHALIPELFDWVLAHGGSITGEHGIGLAKAPWFEGAIGQTATELHRALKACLDPQGILNPGKMFTRK